MAQATLNRVLEEIEMLEPEELEQVEQAIRAILPRKNSAASMTTTNRDEIAAANALLRETVATLDYVTSADNESIDADLAREYGDNHVALFGAGGSK